MLAPVGATRIKRVQLHVAPGPSILSSIHLADTPRAGRAGMICTKCSPLQVAQDAIFDARSICQREYASAPEVTVYGDPSFTFAYVPSHLHHMTFELVRARAAADPNPIPF